MDRCGFQRSLWAMLGGLTGCVADVDEQTFVIDDPVEVLSVDSDDADVDVVGTDEDHVRIEATRWWTLYRPRVRVRVRDEVVDVSYECSGGQAVCLVEFAIRVPDEVDVTVSADDGETLLSDLRGNLSVTSDWGSIRGYRLESPHTQVDTVNGDVRLLYRTAPMDVFVDARGGDVELESPRTATPSTCSASWARS